MKKIIIMILTVIFCLFSETLFEVKDASNNPVLNVSTDGLSVLNQGDTVMVISSNAVKVNLDNSKDKALSRTFSVTTATSKKGLANVLEVGTQSTTMREGSLGEQYTDFSPVNIFIGLNSGINTIPSANHGYDNVFLGNSAGRDNIYGYKNVFIGDEAGMSITGNSYSDMGSQNVFIGTGAGKNATGSVANIAIGVNAGAESGYLNTCVGHSSGQKQTGWRNTFYGYHSGQNSTTGDNNTCVGAQAGESLSTGTGNILLGYQSGQSTYYANNNVLIGNNTARYLRYDQNVVIGYQAGYNLQYSAGNVLLGYQAGYSETGSNRLYIDNSNTTIPLIYGEFDNNRIGINDNAPSANLHIKQNGLGEEGLAIENDGDTDYWSWEIGDNDLNFYFNGTQVGYWNDADGSYTAISDSRLKKDIHEITNPILKKILELKLVDYRLLHSDESSQKTLGFIAQDVQKVLPEIVKEREDGYLSINYDDFGVISIKAIQEQQAIIDELKAENKELKSRLDKLEELLIKE